MNIPKDSSPSNKTQQSKQCDMLNGATNEIDANKNLTIVSNFGPECQILKCPYCYGFINTKVKSKVTIKTHLSALIMCFCCFCLCFGCPYCKGSCKDRYHYCPDCNAFLGTYRY